MILKYLLKGTVVDNSPGDTDLDIKGLKFDSRAVTPGDAFFAISGTVADGHKFIEAAAAAGASCIICEQMPKKIMPNTTYVKVADSRTALATAAHNFYANPTENMKVYGITGTNGKTSITFLLKSIFELAGKKSGLIGTTGIIYGDIEKELDNTTPDPVTLAAAFAEMKRAGVEYVFMEVSSHALDQKRTLGISFDMGLFTNLSHDHLDYHNSVEDYARAKKKLFDSLSPASSAIVNRDDEYAEYMISDTPANHILVGRNEECDYYISGGKIQAGHTEFMINETPIVTPLSGKFNIDNASLVFAAAITAGIDEKTCIDALAQAVTAPGRMESIKIKTGATAFMDYAHTPDALEKALRACIEINNRKAKIFCVIGCGGDRDKTKRPVMGRIAARMAHIPVITSDNPRTENPETIIKEMIDGIPLEAREYIIIEPDRKKAIEIACKLSGENDIILVAGKGHEEYQIIGKEKFRLSDREEIEKWK